MSGLGDIEVLHDSNTRLGFVAVWDGYVEDCRLTLH